MADSNNDEKLKTFVENGGVLICDEGFALRDRKNTWLRVDSVPFSFMNAKMQKRRLSRGVEKFSLGGSEVSVNPYRTWYQTNGKVLATFEDGEAAIQEISYGKGKILLFSTSVGYSYKTDKESGWRIFMRKYIEEHTDAKPKKYADSVNDIHHQTLEIENDTIEIVQNYSQTTIEIEKQANVEILTETDCTNGVILLKPTETVCFLTKNTR